VSAYRRIGVSPWDIPPRFNDPSVGLVDHFDDLPDDLVTCVIESRERLRRDISVTKCNLQVYLAPREPRLAILVAGINQAVI
jgi:hypothetical protein